MEAIQCKGPCVKYLCNFYRCNYKALLAYLCNLKISTLTAYENI